MLAYPMLYRIVRKKYVTVDSVLSSAPLNVSFQRTLVGDKIVAWFELVSRVAYVNLTDEDDNFTVRSMYTALIQQNTITKKM